MNSIFRIALGVCLLAGCLLEYARAQRLEPRPSDIEFLQFIFESVSSEAKDPEVARLNEFGIAGLYGLSQSESLALHVAGSAYGAALVQFRSKKSILDQRFEQGGSAYVWEINRINSDFERDMIQAAEGFLNALRPERVTLFQRKADITRSRGAAARELHPHVKEKEAR